jgi:hypothetical protein
MRGLEKMFSSQVRRCSSQNYPILRENRQTILTGYAMGMPSSKIKCLNGRPEAAALWSSCLTRVKMAAYVSG